MADVSVLGYIFYTMIAMILAILITNIVSNMMGPNIAAPLGPKPSIADLLSELNMLIELECIALIDIPQSVKAIPLITDFQSLQNELIHNVVESLSTRMWREFNNAGVKRNYVLKYITRKCHAEMLKFMENNNFSLREDGEKYMEAVQGNNR